MASLTPSNITPEAFNEVLSRYPAAVPKKLRDLDTLRFSTLPARVVERRAEHHGNAWLELGEVISLVEWKLKHGTFRPSLLSLVSSNAPSTLVSATEVAFAVLRSPPPSPTTSHPTPSNPTIAALDLLTPLRGIGPATASLILSVAAPATAPFFSDELFRWVMWEEAEGKRGKGWGRRIGYTAKEFSGLVEGLERVRMRLGVRAVDCERVAWVLGREGVDLGGREREGEGGVGQVVGEGKGKERRKAGKEEGVKKSGSGVPHKTKTSKSEGKAEEKSGGGEGSGGKTSKSVGKATAASVKGEEPRRSKRKPAALDLPGESTSTKRRLK